MKILLINAQSVKTAYSDIVNIVQLYDVDIVCFNETFQEEDSKLKFLNWRVYDKPRVGRKGGGVAIYVKENNAKFVAVENTDYNSVEYESVAVNITTDTGMRFSLLCPYIPPEKHEQMEKLCSKIDDIKGKTSKPLIIAGDLNAKSLEWNNTKVNKAGELIENMITKHDMICVNDGQPTRRNTDSVIDLFLMNSEFQQFLTSCDTLTHENIRSDHISVLMNMKVSTEDKQ